MTDRRERRTRVRAAAAAALVTMMVTVLGVAPATAASGVSAQTVLDTLAVASESSTSPDDDAFLRWDEPDGTGCTVLDDVLVAESTTATDGGCPVTSGSWTSPWDGEVRTAAADMSVVHLVPIDEAWKSGADTWSALLRERYAMETEWDPTLVAVTTEAADARAGADPGTWMPEGDAASCAYVGDWLTVKLRWDLAVDPLEHAAIQNMLSGPCDGLTLEEPPNAPGPGYWFRDVDYYHPYTTHISWMATAGISQGYGASGWYAPRNDVNRGQMATFLYKVAGAPEYDAPAASAFDDVPTSHVFYPHISWLADEGITQGYGNGDFGPSDEVTRGQMAAFLYKLAGAPAHTPPAVSPFPDVPTSHTFYQHISWLAGTGITSGHADGDFKPNGLVTRGQMAVFLFKFSATVAS
ncbi:S-layer homology domain-containing protein [Demequina activiva]|uniref:SLH domain-containing protein n=1 Tax=Demequina activiva TaxID=1582364 RepID=A0A919UIS8_9MICO|nr:S-layer homology domain-containing protein [Demequina activiva]GIG53666.1 hypothetical protein Dac01nite_04180 [Demequina activiva]